MFRQMVLGTAAAPQAVALALFNAHPFVVAQAIETGWNNRVIGMPNALPSPAPLPVVFGANNPPAAIPVPNPGFLIDHLIYAYMVENTRILEIFRRVVHEYLHGEQLGVPPDTPANPNDHIVPWLRTTEDLFFKDSAPFHAYSLTSYIRPDWSATRRNAYYRMFGYDLNHGGADGKPYAFVKPVAANKEFGPTLERLLAEVWRGVVNANNTSGKRDTDDAAIAALSLRMNDMLGTRRGGDNMRREEFFAVCMLSWFHVAIMWDSPIVIALKAQSESPAERLQKIGERVGMPCHGRSEAFLELAPLMSWLLYSIEIGTFNVAAAAPLLYLINQNLLTQIVTRYVTATGRDMKAATVTISARP